MPKPIIVAEDGSTPDKKSGRKLKRQNARGVTFSLAEGWLNEAQRLAKVREASEQALRKEDRNKKVKETLTTAIEVIATAEKEAWMYTLVFASTLTPRDRTRFKRLAYRRFLAKDNLARHLAPGLPVTDMDDKRLRKAVRKAFGIKLKKKIDRLPGFRGLGGDWVDDERGLNLGLLGL
jgi:hypothetical protein